MRCDLLARGSSLFVGEKSTKLLSSRTHTSHSQVHDGMRTRVVEPEPEIFALTASLEDLAPFESLFESRPAAPNLAEYVGIIGGFNLEDFFAHQVLTEEMH